MQPDTKRCSRCGLTLPIEDFNRRRASADGRQIYCRRCIADWARTHRPRKLREAPVVGPGQKWCRRCDTTKDLTDFASNKSAKAGLQAYCRSCGAAAYRERRTREGHVVRPANVPAGQKHCRSCDDTVKPLSDWSRNSWASDGFQTLCKACASAAGRRDHLKRQYGMTPEDLQDLLAGQNGICIVCLRAPAVHVDHDHVTGEVRGMLCFRCNAGLGQLYEDPVTLRRAADYLEGRRFGLRSIGPGAVEILYPDPPREPHPELGPARPPFDIGPLRALARRNLGTSA